MYRNSKEAAAHHRSSFNTITVWFGKDEEGKPDRYVGVNLFYLTLDIVIAVGIYKLVAWLLS